VGEDCPIHKLDAICELRQDFSDWLHGRLILMPRDATTFKSLNGLVRQYLKMQKIEKPSRNLTDCLAAIAINEAIPNDIERKFADVIEVPENRFGQERLNEALKGVVSTYSKKAMKQYTIRRMNDSKFKWKRAVDVITNGYTRKYRKEYRASHLDAGFNRFKIEPIRVKTGNA